MSPSVVLLGPTTVRGPCVVDPEVAGLALDGIDDDLALVDDRPVPVRELWSDLLGSAIDADADGVVLICPSWWSAGRVTIVEAAARNWCTHVAIRRRCEVLAAGPVVEIAQELVVVHTGAQRRVVARTGPAARVVDTVVAGLDGHGPVTVDVPTGTTQFGAELTEALRGHGIAVRVTDDHDVVAAAVEQSAAPTVPTVRRAVSPRAAALVAAGLVVTALGGAALWPGGGSATGEAVTWLVEGRVAVEVPAAWTVQRITSGSGSARVQVVSPDGGSEAVYVTQARAGDSTLADTAASLRVALAGEIGEVFVDFTADDRRADRPAVTYREVRRDRRVWWAVLLDRGVRIAIGCQSAVDSVSPVCERAIRSARAVG